MKEIYKYKLVVNDHQIILLPKGAKILTVQNQNENICLWAFIDSDTFEKEDRVIRMIGTGYSIEDNFWEKYKYLNTIQMRGGFTVLHVFEDVFND